jgi:hypothetical protein
MKSRRCAIGAMSRVKLKLRFGYSVPLTALVETGIRIVYPFHDICGTHVAAEARFVLDHELLAQARPQSRREHFARLMDFYDIKAAAGHL